MVEKGQEEEEEDNDSDGDNNARGLSMNAYGIVSKSSKITTESTT